MSTPQRNKWMPTLLTLALAAVAFAVQWGALWAKLDQMEKRLDEFLIEAHTLRAQYQAINQRLSYLEGAHGLTPPKGEQP
jgi:hypothetical protein